MAGTKSAYAARLERQGQQLVELVDVLRAVEAGVREGRTLLDGVATGTLWGWRARQFLTHVLDEPLANWDARQGRTQLERLALVARALAELGVEEKRRGGWKVTLALVLSLAGVLEQGCAPPERVACSGPEPITCECVDSCSSDDAGVITTSPDAAQSLAQGCVVRCWDRSVRGDR